MLFIVLLCQYGGSEAFPLQVACYNYNCPSEVITLLVKKNPDALCHFACNTVHSEHLGIVQLLFDAYPEAIWTRDVDGETPLDIAKRAAQSRNPSNIVSFVEAQMMIAPANVQSIQLWSNFYLRT